MNSACLPHTVNPPIALGSLQVLRMPKHANHVTISQEIGFNFPISQFFGIEEFPLEVETSVLPIWLMHVFHITGQTK
jgi:hypothetical protein